MAKTKKSKVVAWIIVGLIVVAAAVAVSFFVSSMVVPSRLVVPQDQTNIEVKKGQEFVITLSSNASTGYSWAVDEAYNKSIVTKVSNKYTAASNAIGGSGSEQWVFKGTAAGTTQLTFTYARQWEANSSQTDSKVYTVTVK